LTFLKKIFFLFLFGGLSIYCFPQQIVLNENFDDNINNWPITQNFGNKSSIKDGKYRVEIRVGNILLDKLISLDFNETRNFVIETEITRLAGHAPFGISWGAKGEGSRFNFVITDSGKYAINKWDNYMPTPLIKYTYSKYIKPDSAINKLTIKKIRNKLLFFVNNKYVTQIAFQKFYGHQVGLYSGSGFLILEIEYLKVYYPFDEDD